MILLKVNQMETPNIQNLLKNGHTIKLQEANNVVSEELNRRKDKY